MGAKQRGEGFVKTAFRGEWGAGVMGTLNIDKSTQTSEVTTFGSEQGSDVKGADARTTGTIEKSSHPLDMEALVLKYSNGMDRVHDAYANALDFSKGSNGASKDLQLHHASEQMHSGKPLVGLSNGVAESSALFSTTAANKKETHILKTAAEMFIEDELAVLRTRGGISRRSDGKVAGGGQPKSVIEMFIDNQIGKNGEAVASTGGEAMLIGDGGQGQRSWDHGTRTRSENAGNNTKADGVDNNTEMLLGRGRMYDRAAIDRYLLGNSTAPLRLDHQVHAIAITKIHHTDACNGTDPASPFTSFTYSANFQRNDL
jgi:hypothetical protein